MIKVLQWGFEGLLALAILVVAYSQILLPLFRGTPMFPFFRRRPKLERELERVTEEIEDRDLAARLAERRRELDGTSDTDK